MELVFHICATVIAGSSNTEITKRFTYIDPGTYNSSYINVITGMIVTTTSGKPANFACGGR